MGENFGGFRAYNYDVASPRTYSATQFPRSTWLRRSMVTTTPGTTTTPCSLNQGLNSSFTYDSLNRLFGVNYPGMGKAYNMKYDEYGNRWSQTYTQGSGVNQTFTIDQSTNRISGMPYDQFGNQTGDGLHNYSYDAENNVTSVDNGSTATYNYDALKHRTMVQTSAGTTLYGFDVDGHRFASWTGSQSSGLTLTGFNVFWGNRLLATFKSGHVYYQHVDALGTVRATTDGTGTIAGIYQSLPFGDASATAGTDADPQHFAQLDRDALTDTHNANFRMYHAAEGRWMSPDPFRGSYSMADPESFNRYAYLESNPLSGLDPSGLKRPSSGIDDDDDGHGGGLAILTGQGYSFGERTLL